MPGYKLREMIAYACTLFESTYHIGLGALVNSLFRNGFRETFFAGYRGALPPWATPVATKDGVSDFDVAEGCRIRFVALDTSLHLASYKPIFMRQVFEQFLKARMLCVTSIRILPLSAGGVFLRSGCRTD